MRTLALLGYFQLFIYIYIFIYLFIYLFIYVPLYIVAFMGGAAEPGGEFSIGGISTLGWHREF